MHLIVLISSTVKEDVRCNDVSLHKLERGDYLRVGFIRNNIGFQIAALPWQLLMVGFGIAILPGNIVFFAEFGMCRFTWPSC